MKKIFGILVCMLFIICTFSSASNVQNPNNWDWILDQHCLASYGSVIIFEPYDLAQSFTPSMLILGPIRVCIFQIGQCTEPINAYIRKELDGTNLNHVVIYPEDVVPDIPNFIHIGFEDGRRVNPGETYYIVLESEQGDWGDNRWEWSAFGGLGMDCYPNGESWWYYMGDFNEPWEWEKRFDGTEDFTFETYGRGNTRPPPPTPPSGTTSGAAGQLYSYKTLASDPEEDMVRYGWDWDGDFSVDEWSEYFESGVEITMDHVWEEQGSYEIRVKAMDYFEFESEWSDPLVVSMAKNKQSINTQQNSPPNTPIQPFGPTSGNIGFIYRYSTYVTDPDGDAFRLGWDWDGDHVVDDWYQWARNGTHDFGHSWEEKGRYRISVKSEDEHGASSDWSDPLQFITPKNKPYIKIPFLNFLENHTHLYPLLRQLLKL
jgi:hypothetical protein